MANAGRAIRRSSWLATTALTPIAVVVPSLACGQVVLDGATGPSGAITGPDYQITDDLGKRAGDNLFHSFSDFSIATGERATFSGPDEIENVISRVTGTNPSDIDGTLRSTMPEADFYFINPNGVTFGPNAALDVQGSFHVSTADELRFDGGEVYSASDPDASGFAVAEPRAFGFFDADPGAILVDGSALKVGRGETISLIGGDITIIGANNGGNQTTVRAEGGEVALIGLSGPGQAFIKDNVTDTAQLANIQLTDGALIDVSGDGGGQVRIRAGRLSMDNGSQALANSRGSENAQRGIEIEANEMELDAGARLATDALGSGRGGDLTIKADDLSITDGAIIGSVAFAEGDSGAVMIDAEKLEIDGKGSFTSIFTATAVDSIGDASSLTVLADEIEVRRGGAIESATQSIGDAGTVTIVAGRINVFDANAPTRTGISSSSLSTAMGNAGEIDVTVGELELKTGGQIGASTFGSGNAGSVTVAADRVVIARDGADSVSLIASSADVGSTGNAGAVDVIANELELLTGGQILSSTFGIGNAGAVTVDADHLLISGAQGLSAILSTAEAGSSGAAGSVEIISEQIELVEGGFISSDTFGQGDAGDTKVKAESLFISDDDGSKFFTGIGSRARAGSEGNAGSVEVSADMLEIRGGSEISSGTFAAGDAGSVIVEAERLLIIGDGSARASGIGSQANRGGSGAAGDVTVVAGELEMRRGGVISSATFGTGNGGLVDVTADRITVDVEQSGLFTGIASSAQPGAEGSAGSVTVMTGELDIQGGALNSSTFGTGDAGEVSVTAERITIIGDDTRSLSGLATVAEANSSGNAGDVTVTAPTIILMDGGTIASFNAGSGLGGNVTIDARETLMSTKGRITAATLSADAGDIAIDAGRILSLVDSEITTSSANGQGSGGNIDIRREFVALNDSSIIARARQGDGGNIRIVVDQFIASPDSQVDASSETGIDGTVLVTSPEVDLADRLLVLDNQFTDASHLLRESCESGGDLGGSTFVTSGRAPKIVPGDGLLPGFYSGALVAEEDEGTVDQPIILVVPCPKVKAS